jgi:hypothetical protein
MANVIPKQYKDEIATALVEETWRVALLTNAYVYADTHVVYGDVTAWEVASGGGYTTGGVQVLPAAKSKAYSGSDVLIDITVDTQWTIATFSAQYACIYNDGATKSIRAIYDFTNKTVTGGTFTIQWSNAPAAVMKVSSV